MPRHDCKQCGETFLDRRPHARFCSTRCYGLSKRTLPDRACERCGSAFRSREEKPRFCGKDCYEASRQATAYTPNHVCEHCGEAFHDSHPETRFCSRECFGLGTRTAQEKTCPQCGKAFRSFLCRPSIHCGQACHTAARARTRTCAGCGQTFKPRRAGSRSCSRQCRAVAARRLKEKTCLWCGITFHPRKAGALYCNVTCYGLSQHSGHPRSGLNFTPKHKRLIAERDGRLCRLCGATDTLDFDHIVAICNGGTNDLSNGQILCEACHVAKSTRDKAECRHRRLGEGDVPEIVYIPLT